MNAPRNTCTTRHVQPLQVVLGRPNFFPFAAVYDGSERCCSTVGKHTGSLGRLQSPVLPPADPVEKICNLQRRGEGPDK